MTAFLNWPEILNHSVAIGVVIFFGIALTWIGRRLFGTNGLITKSTEAATSAMQTQTETLQALRTNAAMQHELCGRHTDAMIALEASTSGMTEGLGIVGTKLDEAAAVAEQVAEEWGDVGSQELRVVHVLDAMLRCVETATRIIDDRWGGDMRQLTAQIETIKAKIGKKRNP